MRVVTRNFHTIMPITFEDLYPTLYQLYYFLVVLVKHFSEKGLANVWTPGVSTQLWIIVKNPDPIFLFF